MVSVFILWYVGGNCTELRRGNCWIDKKPAQMFGLFLLFSPQRAFLTGDQLRYSEWRPSETCGEYTPLPAVHSLHRMTVNLDLNLFWGAVACMWGYAVFTFTSQNHVCALGSLPWSLSHQLRFKGGRGRWVWGLAPRWHFQLDQLAAISAFYLQKSQCHYGTVCQDPRTMLMLVRSLKSETAGLPVPL